MQGASLRGLALQGFLGSAFPGPVRPGDAVQGKARIFDNLIGNVRGRCVVLRQRHVAKVGELFQEAGQPDHWDGQAE